MTKPNDPAFPSQYEVGMREVECHGLTKREWFAGMAMQGLLANEVRDASIKGYVLDALQFADEMIKELGEVEG